LLGTKRGGTLAVPGHDVLMDAAKLMLVAAVVSFTADLSIISLGLKMFSGSETILNPESTFSAWDPSVVNILSCVDSILGEAGG
jgi:intracellular septation protein A